MSLAGDLRREWAHETDATNPLVTIGLSAGVLNLGLSTDDLYHYITRDVARRLVMRFHPDRVEGTDALVTASQRRFAEAYRALQDRDQFERALSAFRVHRAGDRADTRVHEEAIADLRRRLVASQTQAQAAAQEGERLAAVVRAQAHALEIAAGWKDHAAESLQALAQSRRALDYARADGADVTTYVRALIAAGTGPAAGAARWVVVARREQAPQPMDRRARLHYRRIFARRVAACRARLGKIAEVTADEGATLEAGALALVRQIPVRFLLDVYALQRGRIVGTTGVVLGSMRPAPPWPSRLVRLRLSQLLARTEPQIRCAWLLVSARLRPGKGARPVVVPSMHRLVVAVSGEG